MHFCADALYTDGHGYLVLLTLGSVLLTLGTAIFRSCGLDPKFLA